MCVWFWRIQGEYGAEGPLRLTRDDAEKDGAEVFRALATADGRVEKAKLAQQVLQLLRKGATYEDKTKALCAKREVARRAEERMLYQAAEEHAIPLAIGL